MFIRSRAFRVKRQWLQNRVFHVLDPPWPWSPTGHEPFFSRPPRRFPKPTLEGRGAPEIFPREPRSLQGQDQIHKVSMLKTFEICVFGPQGSQKNTLGPCFDAPNSPPGPSRVAPLILKVASGPPKSSRGPPWASPGALQDPQGPHRAPLKISSSDRFF